MIKIITPYSINDIRVGSNRSEIDLDKTKQNGLFIEFEKDMVIAISFRNEPLFELNGEVIDINKASLFLSQENPYYDGDTFTFPHLNLCIYGLQRIISTGEISYECTLYDSPFKYLYEKNIDRLPKYNSLIAKHPIQNLTLTPFSSLGPFKFSMTEIELKGLFGKPLSVSIGVKNKIIYEYKNCTIRFDKGLLTQISIDFNESDSCRFPLIIKSLDISTTDGLCELIKISETFERTGYFVFPELGLTIDKPNIKGQSNQFYFFDNTLKTFWMNTNRPITSW